MDDTIRFIYPDTNSHKILQNIFVVVLAMIDCIAVNEASGWIGAQLYSV